MLEYQLLYLIKFCNRPQNGIYENIRKRRWLGVSSCTAAVDYHIMVAWKYSFERGELSKLI